MRLLTEILAGTKTAVGDGSGFDPWKLLTIPGAVVALATLISSYGIGLVRPLSIKKARYWHVNGVTKYSCFIRNRSFVIDRTLTGLTLVEAPGRLKRTFWPFWKRKRQRLEFLLWDVPKDLKVTKRNEELIEGRIRKGSDDGIFDPGPRSRVFAHAGSRPSRAKRLKKDED